MQEGSSPGVHNGNPYGTYFHFDFFTHFVINQQLHRVVAPLNEHQLIGLTRHGVRKWCSEPDSSLDPQTQCKGKDLMQQSTLYTAIHVVCSHGKANLESFFGSAVLSKACKDNYIVILHVLS